VKPLILTLVIAVITTTIGAGWAITQFHSIFYSNSPETDKNLIAYKQLGKAIGATLDEFSQKNEFVLHWKEQSDIDISFQERSDIPIPENFKQAFHAGEPLLLESEEEMSIHLYMKNSDQIMSMLLPIQSDDQKSLLNILLTLLFYLVVIAVLLIWLYPLIKRLVILQRTANQFGLGNLSSRIKPSKFSYISSIETEFNRMAGQIQKLMDDNQLLGRAVSHNLKTPITRLRMGIDVLEEATEKSARDRYIERINNDLDEMQSLVETLLQYSSLDEFSLRLNMVEIDLRQFIPILIENVNQTDIDISVIIEQDNAVVNTDQKYLAMALNNILSNAIQYAKGKIVVRVDQQNQTKQNSTLSISIEDDGMGISEAERIDVLKPFWRGQKNPAIKGHGMGLAIVARIADWLNADLTIDASASLGGACVSLIFKENIS